MMKKRVIQTEVSPEVYEFVARTAKAKGLSLKEAAREALREWATRNGDLSWDPLFDPGWGFKGARRRTPRRWMRSSMGGRRGDEALPGFGRVHRPSPRQGSVPRGPRPPTDPHSNPEGPTRRSLRVLRRVSVERRLATG